MDNYSVSLSLLNKTKKNNSSMKQEKKAKIEDLTVASKASQKVYYENILPDTNIEYIVNGSGVKENIVVKSAQSSYEYNFEIAVKDVTLSLAEDGCIYAKDTTTGTTVFVMPKPFMLDANYEYSNKVSYSLIAKNKHKYEITISADPEWLNSSKRAFPVTIDPAIQTKQSISTIVCIILAVAITFVLSPDLKGMVYLASNEEILGTNEERAIKVLNATENKLFSPIDDVKANVKNISFVLPFSRQIRSQHLDGLLYERAKDKAYRKELMKIVNVII